MRTPFGVVSVIGGALAEGLGFAGTVDHRRQVQLSAADQWYRDHRRRAFWARVGRYLLRHWDWVVPVLLFLFVWIVGGDFGGFIGVVVAVPVWIGCLRLKQKRHDAAIQSHFDRVRAFGGPELFNLDQRVHASWTQLTLAVGLARRRSALSGFGANEAYRQAVSETEQLRQAAFGADLQQYEFPALLPPQRNVLGLMYPVALLQGQTLDTWTAQSQALTDAWSVPSVRVVQTQPGFVELHLVLFDPLAQTIEISPAALPVASTKWVEVGRMEDGTQMRFNLDQTNNVVGGVPGSGKSVMLNVLLSGVAPVPEVQIVGIDCKEMIELHDWQPRLSATAGNQDAALEVLETIFNIGLARLQSLRGSGSKSLSRKGYSVEEPLILVIIDECAELFEAEDSSKEAKQRADRLRQLISKGVRLFRAAGITFVLATQKPTTDSIPSIIRDNCPGRTAFLCTTNEQGVAIMGPEISSASVSPVNIVDDTAHRGYAVSRQGNDFAFGRVFWVTEATGAEVARATAPLRRSLDDLLRTAEATPALTLVPDSAADPGYDLDPELARLLDTPEGEDFFAS